MENYGVVLFPGTSAALRAEKVLKQAGIAIRLIPVPRELSSNCGIAVRFLWGDRAHVEQVLTDANVAIEGVYPLP